MTSCFSEPRWEESSSHDSGSWTLHPLSDPHSERSVPLCTFFYSRTADSCAALIERFMPGGEIDSVDKDGNTPLHIAARYGHELLINSLITSGADCTRSVGSPLGPCPVPLLQLLTESTVVSAKTRSPRHVPSPLGCLERSLGVLQEAAVFR